jgi:predicted MFS family arabinose efflux permease
MKLFCRKFPTPLLGRLKIHMARHTKNTAENWIGQTPKREGFLLCPIPKLLRFSKHMKKFFRTMFDPTIIRSPLFLVFALSNFLLYFWYDVPYVFSVDQAKGLGISDRKASFLLSVIGIVNTFGQIIYGYIGDKNINLSLIYGLSISTAGLAIMFYTVFTSSNMVRKNFFMCFEYLSSFGMGHK